MLKGLVRRPVVSVLGLGLSRVSESKLWSARGGRCPAAPAVLPTAWARGLWAGWRNLEEPLAGKVTADIFTGEAQGLQLGWLSRVNV